MRSRHESRHDGGIPQKQGRPRAYPAMNPATMAGFRLAAVPRVEAPL
jgi:hypothetical protein